MVIKWRQLPVIQRQNADLACAISSAASKWQPTTTHIRIWSSTKFALDLNTGSRYLSEVNKIDALLGHSNTVLPDWQKLTSICAAQTVPLK